MSVNTLSTILAALPSLSSNELDAVIATATALKAVNNRPQRARRPAKPAAAPGGGKQKGPAKQVSPYDSVSEYKAFKVADKELRALLKGLKADLISLEAFIAGNSDAINVSNLRDEEQKDHDLVRARAEPVLAKFRTAQSEWFRVKGDLAHDSSEAAAGSQAVQPAAAANSSPKGQE
jgi:hypothetical protein